ncbi:MAG TPA: tetratricopeptide repeat protein [Thermoanaerobaculia bacterium]|jgi:tetratricopeptide (TPR) repeat protein
MTGGARFAKFEARFATERELAAPYVETIRHDPPSAPPPGWITLGFAYELCGAAHEASTPAESAALAQLAIGVAERLDDSYPRVARRHILARAWKELAHAHRTRGKHADALAALDRANAAIGDEAALGWDETVVTLCRATTLSNLHRHEEALRLVGEARAAFEQLGDRRLVIQCELQYGTIADRRGDFGAAERAYREASRLALAAGDVRTAGSAWLNLGALAARGGRVAEALESLARARALFRELDARDELARGDLWIGVALLAAGNPDQAIPLLSGARDAFRTLDMPEESGLAGVDLAEAFLVLGRVEAARQLLGEVIDEFRRHHLNERAVVALTYLRDLPAPARGTAQQVRAYLERLRREPHLLFAVPDER